MTTARCEQISHSNLLELLHYDPGTGVFTWRARRRRVQAGSIAGCITIEKYRVIGLGGATCRANRLAWFYVHQKWPEHQIDHLDGDRDNNRIANLRDVEPGVNTQNQTRPMRRNRAGFLGVYAGYKGKWYAKISVGGVNFHLGQFATAEQAHAAYIDAKRRMHPGHLG